MSTRTPIFVTLLLAAALPALAAQETQRRERLQPGADAVQGRAHAAALAGAFVRLHARRPDLTARADADGDGHWSADELRTLYQDWAPTLVGHADDDGDRAVSLAEWNHLAGQPRSVRRTSTHSVGGVVATRANLVVGNQQAYVGDYDVEGDQYDPQVQTIQSGTVHDVEVVDVGD